MNEQILVVPRRLLFGEGASPQGFLPQGLADLEARIRAGAAFRPRPAMEEDPSFKQIIPYVVLRREGEVFLLHRLPRQDEKRLHDKYSIGVGGHINPVDGAGGDLLRAGLLRELEEEVAIEGPCDLRLEGAINDDSNPVGSVHFGLVYEARIGGTVEVREKDKMEGRFVADEELADWRERMETWSQIVFDALFASSARR